MDCYALVSIIANQINSSCAVHSSSNIWQGCRITRCMYTAFQIRIYRTSKTACHQHQEIMMISLIPNYNHLGTILNFTLRDFFDDKTITLVTIKCNQNNCNHSSTTPNCLPHSMQMPSATFGRHWKSDESWNWCNPEVFGHRVSTTFEPQGVQWCRMWRKIQNGATTFYWGVSSISPAVPWNVTIHALVLYYNRANRKLCMSVVLCVLYLRWNSWMEFLQTEVCSQVLRSTTAYVEKKCINHEISTPSCLTGIFQLHEIVLIEWAIQHCLSVSYEIALINT